MKIISESHTHDLPQRVLDAICARFADREAFFVETIDLSELGVECALRCALVGPIMGDAPVNDEAVEMAPRGDRDWNSRMHRTMTPRETTLLTVIAGPHEGEPCVLYTCYPGPQAPQEPDDPACRDVETSQAFWAQHALAPMEGNDA